MFGKKRKPKVPTGKILGLKINGEDTKVANLKVFTDSQGVGRCDIFAVEPKEILHYDESDLEIRSDEGRKIRIHAKFDGAEQQKRVFVYHMIILEYGEEFA